MIGYTPSHLTENEVILEKLNQIIDYLIKNPSYQVYVYNGGFISGTLTYEIANIINSNNINVADVVVFNNGYYGIISEITETEFTLTAGISLIGPQGPQGPQGPKGDTGTIPDSPTSLPVTYKKASGSFPTSESAWTSIGGANIFYGNSLPATQTWQILNCSPEQISVLVSKLTNGEKIWANFTPYSTRELVYYGDTRLFAVSDDYNMLQIRYNPTTGNVEYRVGSSGYEGKNEIIKWVDTRQSPPNIYAYTISDTFITANTSVKMYLTDEGGVKAQSKAVGSIQVIRDSVPTVAIPYEYEVEQTSAEGLFEVINAYVPSKTSELTNDSGFITAADIPSAGEWQNWSDTSVLTEEGLYEIVTTEYPSDGNKTLFVQYEQGKPNNGACWVSVTTANSISVVTPICSGDGTLRVERRLANSSDPADLLTFKYRKIN